ENGGNRAPQVNAGADQSLQGTAFPFVVSLNGSATDDGQPSPPARLSAQWTQASGPGIVTFSNGDKLAASANLPGVGTYVLRLTVSDGELLSSDDVQIAIDRPPVHSIMIAAG